MNRARLLYLVNGMSDSSVTRLILNLIQRLSNERYDFHVGYLMYADDVMLAQFENAGAHVVNFGMTSNLDLKVINKIAHYIKFNSIQLVHTHILRPDIIGGLATRLARFPLLFSTKHNIGYIRGQRGWLIKNLLYWPLMYLPDQVITVTNTLRHQVISRLRIAPDRVSAIHIGIDVDTFHQRSTRYTCRQNLGLKTDDFVVSYTGRLVTGKGLDYLLFAARQVLLRHPNSCFLIVGDGPLNDGLQGLARDLGITSNVIFTGFRRDIPEILAATDVFVLPSLTEGLPKSLMEAMAAGKASVVTQVGGVVELIEHMVTGIYVPQRDSTALADAICNLLANRTQREDMGQRAQDYVSLNFNERDMVNAYDTLYLAHLKKPRSLEG